MFKRSFDTMGFKRIPLGVKIISIIYYIEVALCALMGLFMLFGANRMTEVVIAASPMLGEFVNALLIRVVAVFLIGLAVVIFVIGRAIWKLKQWGRIVAIIFAIFGVISVIISMVTAFKWTLILRLILHGFIGGYLLFSKEVRERFK